MDTRDTHRRARTLWPLPGGAQTYGDSLLYVLGMVSSHTDTGQVVEGLMDRSQLKSSKAGRSYLRVIHTLGFVDLVGQSVYLTESGRAYLGSPSRAALADALLSRVAGCEEIVALLRPRPLRISALAERMADQGYEWSTLSQLRYRLRWLEEAGLVERHGIARPEYALTAR